MRLDEHRWHWEAPDFDDRKLQAIVEEHVRLGRAQWPRWTWPPMGPYNGFSNEQRIYGWQVLLIAQKMGLIPWPKVCSICKTRNDRIQYHAEDYSRPLTSKPVCQSCHKLVHIRFRAKESWVQLVAKHRVPGKRQWFEDLPMVANQVQGDTQIVQVRGRLQTKGISRRSEVTVQVPVRHRTRKTD